MTTRANTRTLARRTRECHAHECLQTLRLQLAACAPISRHRTCIASSTHHTLLLLTSCWSRATQQASKIQSDRSCLSELWRRRWRGQQRWRRLYWWRCWCSSRRRCAQTPQRRRAVSASRCQFLSFTIAPMAARPTRATGAMSPRPASQRRQRTLRRHRVGWFLSARRR